MSLPLEETWVTLVRHAGDVPRRLSHAGPVHRLVSHEDAGRVAAWAHQVEVEHESEHYHRRSAELYYVLEGEGHVLLDGAAHPVQPGSIVHIPPGVVHAARGRLRLLVIGVPEICEEDTFDLED